MRCGFDLLPRPTGFPLYRVVLPTLLEQWASKAGLLTNLNEFGDIYGIDDYEVNHSIVVFHLRLFTVVPYPYLLRATADFGPSISESCDSTLPVYRRF